MKNKFFFLTVVYTILCFLFVESFFYNDFVASVIPGWHTVILSDVHYFIIFSFSLLILGIGFYLSIYKHKKGMVKITIPYLILSIPLPVLFLKALIWKDNLFPVLFIIIQIFIVGQIYLIIALIIRKMSKINLER